MGVILMRIGTLLLGLLLLAGELARFLAGGTAFPKPIDDLAVGAALLVLGLAGPALRPGWWVAGWAFFTGVMLAALVANVDAAMAAVGKPRAFLYVAALAMLTLIGAASTRWWVRRC